MAAVDTEQQQEVNYNFSLLYKSINNLSSVKYDESTFNAIRHKLIPTYNSSSQCLQYHDDIVHIKNGPFDLDTINSEIIKIIQRCDTLFKKINTSPAKQQFITNLAFKTNRETNERELLGYGYILFEDRRISKLIIGFDLDGEILASVECDEPEFEVDMSMSWAAITTEFINRENDMVITLLDPLIKFDTIPIDTPELRNSYYRIILDTAKHDETYEEGMEDNIQIPSSYQILVNPFRVKSVNKDYDSDKLICPIFPKHASISKLRSHILIFATTPNKPHIVRSNNTTQHRLYPYINNLDNHDGNARTVVIYFDPSTQDAQKALNFIRTYYVDDKNEKIVKLYFNYRRKGVNPFISNMNEPLLGSGIIEDLESGSKADYKIKRDSKKKEFKFNRGHNSFDRKDRNKSCQLKENTTVINNRWKNNKINNNNNRNDVVSQNHKSRNNIKYTPSGTWRKIPPKTLKVTTTTTNNKFSVLESNE